MTAKISLSSIAQRNQDIVEASIDGETVMMSIENGQYYGLDRVGSNIWALLEAPLKVEDICLKLQGIYDVAADRCENDVMSFLATLKENNIVEITA